MSVDEAPRQLGRYFLYDRIATGGMATVHFGRMHGAVGFSRLVAIKRLHPNFVNDAHFVQMFLDEARLAARLEHPNVVSTIDVVADETEVFLVMEHVLGASLEACMKRDTSLRGAPMPIVSAIMCNVLEGLHSAHEALGDRGEPLDIVHRDVSPHNILVGVDGLARVFDFGIAKAATNTQETREGVIKGKVTYMAPEQVRGWADRRADIYAAGVILWELIAGRRRHAGERNDDLFLKLARNELAPPRPPSTIRNDCPTAIDVIVARATDPDPEQRFSSAREMAVALEAAMTPAPPRDVADWIHEIAGARIARIAEVMRRIESNSQPPPDSALTSLGSMGSSSGSMRVVTASIDRSASASNAPSSFESVQTSERPAPPARSWTMPAALLAFTAALLLVGLRTLSQRQDRAAPSIQDAAPAVAAATNGASTTAEVLPAVADAAGSSSSARGAAAPEAGSSARTAPAAPVFQQPRVQHTQPVVAPPVVRPREPVREPTPSSAPARPEPATPPAHKPSCENPFTIGPDGIRQIKPECM